MKAGKNAMLDVLPADLEPAVGLLVTGIVGSCGSPAPLHEAEETIEKLRPAVEALFPKASDSRTFRLIASHAISRIIVTIDDPEFLASEFEPWFNQAVGEGAIKLERWYSYKQFLATDKGFAPQVLDSLDQSSTDIVDLLGDPRQSGTWKRRGLVIGDVQSGKTATYIGVVNKAADAGFKLVVLLTGGTESLRKQTQFRIDEGFLGKDSSVGSHDKVIGVGRHPTHGDFLRGQGMTTYAKDFVTAALHGQAIHIDPNADHPYVFVIKKNKTPLTNLITWLSGQFNGKQFDVPMLVVDDESDYASVNTNYKPNSDASPTAINQKIRELLALTSRSSYLAFTATPFANVFIDHDSYDEALQDDLFPHHYIFALSAPSNYVGARAYFGTSEARITADLLDIIDAHEVFPPRHKSHLAVEHLPASLEDALRAFIVAAAIRILRGDKGPRSMLVNVSRFKNVQAQVFDLVADEFSRIKNAVEIHAQPPVTGPDSHPVLSELADCFASHFADAGHEWKSVRNKLLSAVIDMTVELVNSSRDKTSDDKPRNMIAVGGDVLSRGLTLEGLTVSYFYRIVGAADTLLQMARWFGYRPGYEDLVRVWISPEVADQFRFVADISDELRDQVRVMRGLGRTPEDFGLMVRKHPESLAITAKRGVAETKSMLISLSGRRIETTKIPASAAVVRQNFAAVMEFLAKIDEDSPSAGWSQPGLRYPGKIGVSRDRVSDLLAEFTYDRGNLILANSLDKIIRTQSGKAFQDWTVGIVSGRGAPLELLPGLDLGGAPQRAVRFSQDGTGGSFRVSGTSARLAGSTDLSKTFAHAGDEDLHEPAVYRKLPHPTLLIYPLEPNFDVPPAGDSEVLIAASKDESSRAKQAWEAVAGSSVGERLIPSLMALKLAIPGEPGSKSGDVVYLLNGPAIEEFAQDFEVSEFDAEDLDD